MVQLLKEHDGCQDVTGYNEVLPLANQWAMHAEGTVTFLTPEDGGRRSDQPSGFPFQLHYKGLNWDSIVTFEGGIAPLGVPVHFWMHLTNPAAQKDRMHPGMHFEFRDGRKVIAHGTITRTYL
jgi:hypothetical protein